MNRFCICEDNANGANLLWMNPGYIMTQSSIQSLYLYVCSAQSGNFGTIPALTCSKWEFLNWALIPEFWNWPCVKWDWEIREWCSLWESYVIPLHSRRNSCLLSHKHVEVLFDFSKTKSKSRHTRDQAFGLSLRLQFTNFIQENTLNNAKQGLYKTMSESKTESVSFEECWL